MLVLEHVNQPRCGGNGIKILGEREAYWIHTLQTLDPLGHNREYEVLYSPKLTFYIHHFLYGTSFSTLCSRSKTSCKKQTRRGRKHRGTLRPNNDPLPEHILQM
ncbi:uncharacterized protein ACNLHF_024542 [Anomaloglossus baeobatrachus]